MYAHLEHHTIDTHFYNFITAISVRDSDRQSESISNIRGAFISRSKLLFVSSIGSKLLFVFLIG